jgi:predicted ArsR family transcriptional regulator
MEQLTTNQLIYQYINQHPQATPHQVAQGLHICVGDVRYHLQKLIEAGQVETVGKQFQVAPGRPARRYQVIHTAQVHTLLHILTSFMNVVQNSPELLDTVAQDLIPSDLTTSTLSVVRISSTVQFLNTLGYEARWESRPIHPLVELRTCPYQASKPEKGNYCKLDQAIIQAGTGFKCDLVKTRIDNPVSSCLFELVDLMPLNPS